MRLGTKQELFSRLEPLLFNKAHELGFEIRGGDSFRDPRVFGKMGESKGYGHRNSCHKLKLARDLYLTRDGIFLTDTEDYRELGEWWKEQHRLTRWGGDFSNSDGVHFSLEHKGHM